MASTMFDTSLLPPALLEFVVIADTHYMLPGGSGSSEFHSRAQQTPRAEHALGLVAALRPAFVVHLGDLVQEFPEGADFERAMSEARQQLARCGVSPRLVAGNHDVGDKPDPTSPTDWVSPATLEAYHATFGRSWYSWDEAGLHFVVLNTQIMNTRLPEADAQRRWLEADLRAHAGQRTFIFQHLAPFLVDPNEPDVGHYDNVAEPDRGWLLDLCRQHAVEALFAGHSHYVFINRLGPTRLVVTPSVSFTRPGFGEIFSSAPPDDHGRNDTAKLGFYLVRVAEDGTRLHLVRTHGAVTPVDDDTPERRVITRLSADLPASPLGISLRHPLAPVGEVPIAWPTMVRHPMRNDFPLLACTELGARHLRVPGADLGDPIQRERLAMLRGEGVRITATWLWSDRLDLPAMVARCRDELDTVEVQFAGDALPSAACLDQMRACQVELGKPISLSTMIAREVVAGKQHPRTRIGYRPAELPALDRYLGRHGVRLDRVLCRVDPAGSPWDQMLDGGSTLSLDNVDAIDWLVELTGIDTAAQLNRVAEALLAAAALPGTRVYLDPLVDLDRTMDVVHGLLDRLSNPRPTFHAVRCLSSVLFSAPEPRQPASRGTADGDRLLGVVGSTTAFWLVSPSRGAATRTIDLRASLGLGRGAYQIRHYDLAHATSRDYVLAPSGELPLELSLCLIRVTENG